MRMNFGILPGVEFLSVSMRSDAGARSSNQEEPVIIII